jgi:cysteine desulfurase
MRDRLVQGISANVDRIKYTGHPDRRLPGHASFCAEAIEGEALIFMLTGEGIYANTGSACASKALKTSPVLVAIGVPPGLAQGSIVFTISRGNRLNEIEVAIDTFSRAVKKLRALSPVWKGHRHL